MERYRRAGFTALFFAAVFALLCVLASQGLWEFPPVLQRLLGGLAVWCLAAAWYALRRSAAMADATILELGRAAVKGLALAGDASSSFGYAYLKARLDEEQARVDREGGAVALLCIAAEGLQEVGNRFGPELKSKVAEGVATAMCSSLRIYDMVGALGENEFLVILPNTDRREARNVAERLQSAAVTSWRELPRGRELDFARLRVGLAAYPFNGKAVEDVLVAARDAMERARREAAGGPVVSELFVGGERRSRPVTPQIPDDSAQQ